MATMTASPFAAIRREWTTAASCSTSRAQVAEWARRHPCLAECHTLDDVVVAARDQRPDEVYLALITEFKGGDHLAALTIMRAMYNWIRAEARRCQHRFDSIEDTESSIVLAMLDVASSIPADRHTRLVTYLTMRTLNRIAGRSARYGRPHHEEDVDHGGHLGIERLTAVEMHSSSPDPEVEVLELLAWARDHAVLSPTDTSLLTRCYTTTGTSGGYETREAIAGDLGITRGALDQRCSRAVRKLKHAVVHGISELP